MVTILALAAALLYGSADFLGGFATRRATALSILPASALAGALVVLAAALIAGQAANGAGIRWGLLAGVAGGAGLIVFYAGLAEGPMSVVAPTSALTATVLPVAVALADGERADPAVYAGALICLVAVVLVSAAGPAAQARHGFHVRAIGYGTAAGLCFGLFFVFLRNAGRSGALWPIVASRTAGLAVIVIAACVVRARPVIARGGYRLLLATFGSGIVDASANVCYVLATKGRALRPCRRADVAVPGHDGPAGTVRPG